MKQIYYLILAIFIALVGTFYNGSAHANLGITPTIIVFEDGDRYKDVILLNTTDEVKTFEMSWRFFRMIEDGATYEPIEESISEFDVSKHVFYTPRRVTLPAKKTQKIRLAFRRPKDAPEGDFHAHLQFSPVDTPDLSGEKSQEKSSSAGVSIKVGYSIPVIVRTGKFKESVTFGQIKLKRTQQGKLAVQVPYMRQEGGHGAVGHLYVYHMINGEEKLVGEVQNANIFPEVNRRIVDVILQEEVSQGDLKIVIKSGIDNSVALVEEIFPLSN